MLTYTLAQLRAFTAAAARDDRQRLSDLALVVRIAFGADATGWQQFQNAMTGAARPGTTTETPTHG
ncbi:hypothetical protein NJH49_09000 [Stenotrophomonas maltophilia]|uniref:hypothetical protein n=1 Tax=Stenotrophomonas maltophilia TaxID=40324 RepID=UPI0020978878|nr:hypothetical protein [Stenotrophomonas maltophilia]MCO7398320.1 hypothetical protein [Stenotrophomonas maltophilia]MCO7411522.1 hypothetical protein [Stenotrophomonas maltophilia]HDS1220269.1 hypothetical protein [Stenotrophomonas maltophilia]HDS1233214.1 hypothetical protein [Stenotrophomonas maltophilia]